MQLVLSYSCVDRSISRTMRDGAHVCHMARIEDLEIGPGVRGLMSIASHYGLADIDVVGLRPVASLLD